MTLTMVSRSGFQAAGLACALLLFPTASPLHAREQGGNKKPSLSLKASPSIAFVPARIVLAAEVKGGSDDFEDFYCPTVEWDWGDGTVSTAETDCSPYEAGKSQIKRRYTVDRQFRTAGNYRIQLRFKKGDRITGMATTSIQVRPGLGPGGQ
jgi:hypothetical protein